jgi:uncharacterized YigZ family protein
MRLTACLKRKHKMVDQSYFIPAEERKTEIQVKNSRFISTVSPVFSVEEARQFIDRIRSTYPDASHHVPAFIIGSGATTVMHCNDAGEPPGTAGRPVLTVLKGSNLGDIGVVITRYFGGTKLGTGGLVRAYTDATKKVLEILPRARKTLVYSVKISISYSNYEKTRRLIISYDGVIENEDFLSEVSITAKFPITNLESFKKELIHLTNGKETINLIGTSYLLIPTT